MTELFNSIIAFFMSVVAFFSSLFGFNTKGSKLDLSEFNLVWADEFDGSEIDRTKWVTQDTTEMRKGGYLNGKMVTVDGGYATIHTKYLENGVNEGDPSGWYSAFLTTENLFEQTYGYFETRCIVPKGHGIWSAFWMMNNHAMNNPYPDGSYGAEIDIFEAPYYGSTSPNRVAGAVHWGGYGNEHVSIMVGPTSVANDPYNNFNTYGLEWNEDEYIYYINGKVVQTVKKDRALTSRAPEYLLLSVEVAGSGGKPSKGWPDRIITDNGMDFEADFVIDYVRAYQYK